ncbi:MAG: DinB family protein [Mucilaginibacter sp.]|uniref:DinB family protein n=1 Tax=Mucilaginibacter sp. TaxID=1882438 RepID=UPI003267EC23
MTQYLDKLEEERKLLLERTKDLTVDQYNIIPPGFNNNIIWNMGHILVVSESLLYENSPYKRPEHEFMISSFQRGSTPDEIIEEDDILLIRHSLQQTAQFYKRCTGMNRPGDESVSVSNEVMQFLLFHENMHYRTIARLLEIVRKIKD